MGFGPNSNVAFTPIPCGSGGIPSFVRWGDNLNDFLSVFAKKSVADRFAETDKIKDEWGRMFIMFPNPQYGEWEGSIYKGNWGASAAEKDKMRKDHLERWDYKP